MRKSEVGLAADVLRVKSGIDYTPKEGAESNAVVQQKYKEKTAVLGVGREYDKGRAQASSVSTIQCTIKSQSSLKSRLYSLCPL